MAAAAPAEELGRAGDRIERLLDEIRSMASPPAWQRVDELVHRLVEVYGAGLARMMAMLDQAGTLDERLRERLCDDELVASLLLLHGLHPLPTEVRIRRALERARRRLGADAVELVALDATGVARVRVEGEVRATGAAIDQALRRAVEEAAPEIARIEIDGVATGETRLVQIDLGRSRAAEPSP